MSDIDYTRARPIGSTGEFERIVDDDCPTDLDGSYTGPPDVFKLEFSGWTRHIEFATKEPNQ